MNASSHPRLSTRRDFLRTAALGASLSATAPAFIAHSFGQLHAQAASSQAAVPTGKDAPILVVLQLAGGNDGLNTIVPCANDHYFKARPRLAIPAKSVLKLNDSTGLHPALKGFASLHDAGQLAILQSVGYPNPNRSHFRSTEIWHTASDSDRFERHGWIGRYFDNTCHGCDPTTGIALGLQLPQAFSAKTSVGIALENPTGFRYQQESMAEDSDALGSEKFYREMAGRSLPSDDGAAQSGSSIGALTGAAPVNGAHMASPLDFIERTALNAQVSSDVIQKILNRPPSSSSASPFPNTSLGANLRLISRLIQGGMPTRIYYLNHGGYDTHTNQASTHERLLTEFSDATHAFIQDLKKQGVLDRVLLIAFSEFGRRVQENASQGTDHGAAAPLFLFGSRLKPGLHGPAPELAPDRLLRGDLAHKIDFRAVYSTLLEGWLQTPAAPILGRAWDRLDVLAS